MLCHEELEVSRCVSNVIGARVAHCQWTCSKCLGIPIQQYKRSNSTPDVCAYTQLRNTLDPLKVPDQPVPFRFVAVREFDASLRASMSLSLGSSSYSPPYAPPIVPDIYGCDLWYSTNPVGGNSTTPILNSDCQNAYGGLPEGTDLIEWAINGDPVHRINNHQLPFNSTFGQFIIYLVPRFMFSTRMLN